MKKMVFSLVVLLICVTNSFSYDNYAGIFATDETKEATYHVNKFGEIRFSCSFTPIRIGEPVVHHVGEGSISNTGSSMIDLFHFMRNPTNVHLGGESYEATHNSGWNSITLRISCWNATGLVQLWW